MIKNTYTLNSQPKASEVFDSPYFSKWIKDSLDLLSRKDMRDMLKEVKVLHAIVKADFEALKEFEAIANSNNNKMADN